MSKGFLAFITIVAAGLLASVQLASAAPQSGNLYKDIMDHKNSIQWRNAPDNAIPSEVCTILQACAGAPKLAVLAPTTEGGKKVERGLFLSPTRDKAHPEAMILEHRNIPGDIYFFMVSPDGNLQKTAYLELGGKSWVEMANSLGQPTFAKDKPAWNSWVSKAGEAKPAAAK